MTKMRMCLFLAITSLLMACDNTQVTPDSIAPASTSEPTNKVVLLSEVKWSPLNPARGDQSPQAGTLWGDRNEKVPTGFLVKFLEGFSSPPHIHNVTYRGIVINGLIHNDDPGAKEMWMPAGSFWTQPAGEAHITAAKGSENMAFIEIQEGPYLVRPIEQAFDNGERPINVDPSNIVWVDLPGQSATSSSPKVAYLWGTPQENELNGTLVKIPAGFTGKLSGGGPTFQAVVIQGQLQYQMPNEAEVKTLKPGSYFSAEGKSIHHISSKINKESIIYVRTAGKFDIISAKPNKE